MGELGKYRRLSKDYEALPETSVESIGAPSLPIILLLFLSHDFVKRGRMGLLPSLLRPPKGTVDGVSGQVWGGGGAVDGLLCLVNEAGVAPEKAATRVICGAPSRTRPAMPSLASFPDRLPTQRHGGRKRRLSWA
jgi:hypothetical protein